MMMKKKGMCFGTIFLILLFMNMVFFFFGFSQEQKFEILQKEYNPIIHPADFSTQITNSYFSMPVGKRMVYEAQTEEGIERIETHIPGWTKKIMGVETLVFWDLVYLDGELIEDTRDYIAQDKKGNVWYFGEDVDNYVDGMLVDHSGAWLGGVEGALPGILMKAHPQVGDEYRQEYDKGEAEDVAKVESINETVTVPAGTYSDCIKIFEWNPLEPSGGYKYHSKSAGGTVLEDEEDERVELIELDLEGARCIRLPESYAQEGVLPGYTKDCAEGDLVDLEIEVSGAELKKEITAEDAREIALRKVPGEITDVDIEKKFGKPTYVVEIQFEGKEIDVIIDIDTGEILGTED
jgi:uncharacterized membrane protein YkoI